MMRTPFEVTAIALIIHIRTELGIEENKLVLEIAGDNKVGEEEIQECLELLSTLDL